MTNRVWMVLIAAAIVVVVVLACGRGIKFGQRIDGERSLLLPNEPIPKSDVHASEGPVADNSRCHVCHINYADERIAVAHAQANIGCEKCHGACDAHCGDENNITPPDIMYPKEKINPSCHACHPKDELVPAFHAGFLLAGNTDEQCCTDCHSEHRLAYRTRRWDKSTGKLIMDDKVRMMED